MLEHRGQMLVQVIGRVGEGGEEQHLAVAGIDGRVDLGEDVLLQVLELGVVGRAKPSPSPSRSASITSRSAFRSCSQEGRSMSAS